MNNVQKMMTMAGVNLLALSMTTMDSVSLATTSSSSVKPGDSVQMGEAQLRAIEASHLEVYAGCKWGHAAFDPVQVAGEVLTPEVSALHALMG